MNGIAPNAPSDQGKNAIREKIFRALAFWRQRLLDLSKRNKALNYRPTKVATLELVDEKPAVVFRYLFMDGKAMKFCPTLPSTASAAQGEQQSLFPVATTAAGDQPLSATQSFDEDDLAPSADFKPYALADLEDRHTDDLLQCYCTPERLDISLRRLEEVARTNIEEQGVNTLFLALGFLHFKESENSSEILKSPIVLLPVKLERKSARTGFVILSDEDDPMVNPTLSEYMRQNFGISLPVLPDLSEDEDYDLQSLFVEVRRLASEKRGWSVKDDICLSHFAFQKLVMYKDMERNETNFAGHRLINQLMLRTSAETHIGLPAAIRDMDLDADFCPESTFQVVDADASQLRGIAAVSKGCDIVIEGPPGTGKSQTITNLIAQALSQSKSVLFVSEKMAALQVVYRRLHDVGLAEFCLEMHSTKGSKREVIEDLRKTLDSTLAVVPSATAASAQLGGLRKTLTDYAMEVHCIVEPLGVSPFQAFGFFGEVQDAPRVPYPSDAANTTSKQLDTLVGLGEAIATTSSPLGQIIDHPWRDASKTYYGQSTLDAIEANCQTIEAGFLCILEQIDRLAQTYGLPKIEAFEQVSKAYSFAKCLAQSPAVPVETLRSSEWCTVPQSVCSLIETGRRFTKATNQLMVYYSDSIFGVDHESDIAYVTSRRNRVFGFLSVFDARYRSIVARWRSYKTTKRRCGTLKLADDMRLSCECQKLLMSITGASALGLSVFGCHWKDARSDWSQLSDVCKWIVLFRSFADRMSIGAVAFDVGSKGHADISGIDDCVSRVSVLFRECSSLIEMVGWPSGYFTGMPFQHIRRRIKDLSDSVDKASQWAAFQSALQGAANTPVHVFAESALKGSFLIADLPRVFRRSFYQKWLDGVIECRPLLRQFSTLTHEQRVAQFRQLDQHVLIENRVNLVAKLREAAQEKLNSPDVQSGMRFLRREFAKQKRHSPLRKTIRESEIAIRAIKPCFLMSPISVSQYLDGQFPSFDVVIFDEASQLPTEDAIGAICRGRQLVVVGDPKQLPPTNFFSAQTNSASHVDEEGQPVVEDTESVLEDFQGSGIASCRLKWHYRSADESLINFSNVTFYDSELFTFPSVVTKREQNGLHFVHVPDGVYEGKGLNKREACIVADAIVEHAKTQPSVTLGVGTFNMRQQLAIMDELELRRRQDPSIEPFFSRTNHEPFFVKNLENIQGDERDVIYVSVTYGKDSEGHLRYNFGPINGENGWRRLNVLVTRARTLMKVFSSMRGEEISPANTTSRGPQLLRDFLVFAEHGRLDRTSVNSLLSTESPFERDVMTELMKRGYLVDPQVGAAGYRIDLGVRHPSLAGRYVCGIECDGVAYHSSETARDRDRLRQQVLEARGWEIIRVWSTDWFKERKQQIDKLSAAIENCRKNYLEREETETQRRLKLEAAENARKESELQVIVGNGAEAKVADYVRPTAIPYKVASIPYPRTCILDTPLPTLVDAVVQIVKTEGPIHYEDTRTRLASLWKQRLGSRIEAKINEAMRSAVHSRGIVHKNNFLWHGGDKIAVRNRDGMQVEATSVAVEEQLEAVKLVLKSAGMMEREKLITEVRTVLGVVRNRASADVLGSAIDELVASQEIGEASGGLALRT